MLIRNRKNVIAFLLLTFAMSLVFVIPTFPAYADTSTNVAGTVTNAFNTYMQPQIIGITNNVVLPICDVVLVVAIIVKFALCEINYKRNGGDFAWHALAILGGCLVFCLSAPHWVWTILGWKSA